MNFELIKILDNFDESVKRTDIKVIDAIQLIRLSEALTEIYVHTYSSLSNNCAVWNKCVGWTIFGWKIIVQDEIIM